MNKLCGHRGTGKSQSPCSKPSSPSKLTRKTSLSIPGSFIDATTGSSPSIAPNALLTVASSSSARSNAPSFTNSARQLISTNKTVNAASDVETYWAVRAIRSETLLAAQTTHRDEVGTLLTQAEIRKARDIAQLKREHDARHAKLEAVIIVLSVSFASLALCLVYILILHPPRPKEKPRFGWLSSPHHFTIPIFSPFTSVVETEASFLGARSIMLLILVIGAVAYGLLRRWLKIRGS